jgi:hypothetical protein
MNTHTQTENKKQTKFDELTILIDDFTNIYLPDYLDALELEAFNLISVDDLWAELDDKGAFNIDIIYYNKAMDYLSQNDASLSESIEIAVDMGYSLENLSSETLASLHASQKARDDFWDIKDEIDEILSR